MDLVLIPLSLSFARALGVVAFLPLEFIGQGMGLRLLLALLLALSGLPFVHPGAESSLFSYVTEFLVGFLIALPVVLLVHAADLWGDLFESLRGQTSGSIADPLFQGETSHLALLTKNFLWIGLIGAGVFETTLVQFIRSFSIFGTELELWRKALRLFVEVMSGAMLFVVPFAIVFLAVESIALLAAKLLPSVPLNNEIFAAKMALGFMGLVTLVDTEATASLRILLSELSLF